MCYNLTMAYNFSVFKQNIKNLEDWLKGEMSGIRTGRANPAILDGVKVESYGTFMPVNQVGNVSVEDSRMIRITPWDSSFTKVIEKAITDSNLGLSVSADDKGVRVSFPELTTDRRQALIKIAKQKLEDARVTLRGEREKVIKDLDAQEKTGTLSEDEKFRTKTELQKMVDEVNTNLDGMLSKKEKEIIE